MEARSHDDIEQMLSEKPRLRKLEICNGGLSTLPEALCSASLHKLWIYANLFTELPAEVRTQRKLRELSIESNALTSVPDWINELTALRLLSLERNAITHIDLVGPTSLQELDVSWNPLQSLSLRNLPNLRSLNVARHKLRELPEMGEFPEMEKLSCTLGPLESVPDLGTCTKLRGLSLGDSNLIELPDTLMNLPELSVLHVGDNHIVTWPAHGSSSLESLFINNNKLDQFPEFVGDCEKLWILRAGSNRLTEISDSLGNTPINILDLSRNLLPQIPKCVAAMSALKNLDLRYNPIERWPDFDPPPLLSELDITGCLIEKIPPPVAWEAFGVA